MVYVEKHEVIDEQSSDTVDELTQAVRRAVRETRERAREEENKMRKTVDMIVMASQCARRVMQRTHRKKRKAFAVLLLLARGEMFSEGAGSESELQQAPVLNGVCCDDH